MILSIYVVRQKVVVDELPLPLAMQMGVSPVVVECVFTGNCEEVPMVNGLGGEVGCPGVNGIGCGIDGGGGNGGCTGDGGTWCVAMGVDISKMSALLIGI